MKEGRKKRKKGASLKHKFDDRIQMGEKKEKRANCYEPLIDFKKRNKNEIEKEY